MAPFVLIDFLEGAILNPFRRTVDIVDSSLSCTRYALSHTVPLRCCAKIILCIGCIALTACQSESPNTDNNNQSNSQPEIPAVIEPLVADLTNDSLLPPAEATLNITSEPGFLNLTWDSIPDLQRTSIYKFDRVERLEVLLEQSSDNSMTSLMLASRTHQRAWQSEEFRVELCDSNDCISSPRVSIAEFVENSTSRLRPSVFVQGEEFAKNVALNKNATVMAVSLPAQSAIELYLRPANKWVSTQKISLESSTLVTTRSITLALSPSGDTLSALVSDDQGASELKIIERFGEGWVETTSLDLEETATITTNAAVTNNTNTLSISENSNLILISNNNSLFTTARTPQGWSEASLLLQSQNQPLRSAFSERFAAEAVLKTVAANAGLTRLFTAHSLDQNLWLSVWEKAPGGSALPTWTRISAYQINNINATKSVFMHSDSVGDQLVLAGWELNNDVNNTPVIWRYQIPNVTTLNASATSELSVIDSIRFPFSTQDSATLQFSADSALNNLVLGWQNTNTTSDTADAALISYQSSATARRWQTKLELPEVFPNFAKQGFVQSALLSANGNTMVISIGAGESQTEENRVGELITMQ